MKKKINALFRFLFGILCSQNDLLSHKRMTTDRISNIEEMILNAIAAKDTLALLQNRQLLESLRKDLTKIKNRIQLNNTFLRIPVYYREELQKLKDIKEKQISFYKDLPYQMADEKLRKMINNQLPQEIVDLKRKLKEIDKKRLKRNKIKLTLIRLKTV